MALALMIALQAAAAAPAPASVRGIAPIDFDLASLRAGQTDPLGRPRGCASGESAAILVCGRRGGAYPLEEMTRRYAPERIVAETRLFGNFTGRAYVESKEIAPGQVSNRMMVGIRLPF
jgi:hypothetical protein